MGARTGHGNGIQLQIPESLDDAVTPASCTPALARRPAREAGERGFQQATAGKCEPPGLSYGQGFRGHRWSCRALVGLIGVANLSLETEHVRMILHDVIIYLAAATVAVVVARKLGFGAVLGYLFAGVLVGPWGLRLITDFGNILHFSEMGVVFLLFIIGLELQPARLWVLRRSVFGLGCLQVFVTGVALTGVAYWLSLDWAAAVIVGFGLSLSSTAFVLQMLAEKKELASPHGRAAFGVLLFQDLAVIPLIALVPLLAGGGSSTDGGVQFDQILKALLVLAGFVIGGHYLLRPVFRWVASVQIHEIFTAAALLVVIGSALLMESLGLSMGL